MHNYIYTYNHLDPNEIKTSVERVERRLFYTVVVILLIIIAIILSSCKKFVQIPPPKSQIENTTVFSNDATAISAIRGIYSDMITTSGFISGDPSSLTFLAGFSSDELINYTNPSDNQEFYTNSLTSINSTVLGSLWQPAYFYIANANSAIQGLQTSSSLTESTKTELIGEAKFIRAFCYFYLVNLFGNAPLITGTDYRVNSLAGMVSPDSIYKQIFDDLKDAQIRLSSDYSFSNGERDQPNHWAATALLAKAYLFHGDWALAEQQSSDIINQSQNFSILSNLDSVFLANSQEAIWQLKPTSSIINTNEGFSFILTDAPQIASISNELLNSFETGDLRTQHWLDSISVQGTTYYYPYKYKVQTSSTLTEYSMILRFSEQFLIRAEARVKLNNIIGPTGGISDLNIVRTRAGLQGYMGPTDEENVLRSILHENQVEFFTELGHRWLDLKRVSSVDTVMSIVTPMKGGAWNTNWQLYPIPQSELLNDINLKQNPGYN